MLWEMYQQSKIRGAESSAARAGAEAADASISIMELEGKVDSLALTCQALWELLADRTNLTKDELIEKVNEIDLRDGRADEKMGSDEKCKNCGRVLSQRHHRCMYCGQHIEKAHVFQK